MLFFSPQARFYSNNGFRDGLPVHTSGRAGSGAIRVWLFLRLEGVHLSNVSCSLVQK